MQSTRASNHHQRRESTSDFGNPARSLTWLRRPRSHRLGRTPGPHDEHWRRSAVAPARQAIPCPAVPRIGLQVPCEHVLVGRQIGRLHVDRDTKPAIGGANGPAAALSRDRCRDRKLQIGADSCGSMRNAAHAGITTHLALESGKAPFPGHFPERGTEESNLALRFWRPPCYRYTSPPRSGDCRRSVRRTPLGKSCCTRRSPWRHTGFPAHTADELTGPRPLNPGCGR